eukprot:6188171-Pleurochrysis_carterae.AAC.2
MCNVLRLPRTQRRSTHAAPHTFRTTWRYADACILPSKANMQASAGPPEGVNAQTFRMAAGELQGTELEGESARARTSFSSGVMALHLFPICAHHSQIWRTWRDWRTHTFDGRVHAHIEHTRRYGTSVRSRSRDEATASPSCIRTVFEITTSHSAQHRRGKGRERGREREGAREGARGGESVREAALDRQQIRESDQPTAEPFSPDSWQTRDCSLHSTYKTRLERLKRECLVS